MTLDELVKLAQEFEVTDKHIEELNARLQASEDEYKRKHDPLG